VALIGAELVVGAGFVPDVPVVPVPLSDGAVLLTVDVDVEENGEPDALGEADCDEDHHQYKPIATITTTTAQMICCILVIVNVRLTINNG